VPFRNAHFLAIATSWAEVLGATKIFIGAVWKIVPDIRIADRNTIRP
jgi:7-cyano-7-deazaguanine synthase in queuosine biosynthesis